ncbi:hypothetical protein V5799_032779 [Amblyomma americanum]|uniref:Uncharacterized protein n=1 Tax=Amblyomma americanum TaxID=6943 RepID=A0AAQ4DQ72_AMBAM
MQTAHIRVSSTLKDAPFSTQHLRTTDAVAETVLIAVEAIDASSRFQRFSALLTRGYAALPFTSKRRQPVLISTATAGTCWYVLVCKR